MTDWHLLFQAQQELRDTLSPEFAYLAFTPFANFFGESTMQQTLRNYDLIKELCKEYIEERSATGCPIPGNFFLNKLLKY